MKKKFRITSSLEFQEIIHQQFFANNPAFAIYARPKKQEHSRFGIGISKKIAQAWLRNKCKRQVRMMIQGFSASLPYDFIVLLKPGYLTRKFADNLLLLHKSLHSFIGRRNYVTPSKTS